VWSVFPVCWFYCQPKKKLSSSDLEIWPVRVTVSSELYNLVTMYLRAKYTTSLHSFNGVFSGKTRVSRYQKGKSSLDLNEATDDGVLRCGGISWTVCKQSASRCRQITTPACTSSHNFYRPDALPDAQSTVSTHWRQCVICSSLRCDTIRDAILTCARKWTWVRLMYRSEQQLKSVKQKSKNGYAQK